MALRIQQIDNIGTKGINTDITPWSLPPDFITRGMNFRASDNAIMSSGGSNLWSTSPENFDAGRIMHVRSTSGDYWMVMGSDKVYAFTGGTWHDISNPDGYIGTQANAGALWTFCKLGKIPVINHPLHYPEYWAPVSTGQTLQSLEFAPGETWKDKGITAKVMRSHKNMLIALNLQEGADEAPNAYRWSHPADVNGLPFTWDETDRSALAGRAQVGGQSGALIDGLSLRDSFVLYSENAINMLHLMLDEFVWRRVEVSQTTGVFAKDVVTEVRGIHYFITDGDIVSFNGNTLKSIINNRLRRRMQANMNVSAYKNSYIVRNTVRNEIWFCVPEDTAELPNIAYIYNWQNDSWSLRELPEDIAFANYGAQAVPQVTWNNWQGTWNSQLSPWSNSQLSPMDDTVIGVKPTPSELHILDPYASPSDNSFNTVIERTNYAIGGLRQTVHVSRIFPKLEGGGTVKITLGAQDYPNSPVRWKPSQIFDINTDRKLDIRVTGELLAYRIESASSSGFRLSGIDFEYALAGER